MGIKRDLTKSGYLSKRDSFFLNLVTFRVFTDSRYELYLRKSHRHFSDSASAQERKAKLTVAIKSLSSKLILYLKLMKMIGRRLMKLGKSETKLFVNLGISSFQLRRNNQR